MYITSKYKTDRLKFLNSRYSTPYNCYSENVEAHEKTFEAIQPDKTVKEHCIEFSMDAILIHFSMNSFKLIQGISIEGFGEKYAIFIEKRKYLTIAEKFLEELKIQHITG